MYARYGFFLPFRNCTPFLRALFLDGLHIRCISRGINKQKALDYTFVLGVPSILAAALLEGVDAIKSPEGISIDPVVIIVGMVVSAIVGYFAILIFKWFLKTDKMIIFVVYTALVGIVFLVISCIEMNTGANVFTGAMIQ